jgi:Flp pilus assembly protein TadD
MSLIINMLKDLDSRHHNGTPAQQVLNYQQNRSSSRFNLSKVIAFSSILIFIVTSSSYLFLHKRETNKRSLPLPIEQAIIKSPERTVVPSDDSILKPVVISGVSFEARNDDTEITFLLNHDALYRLVNDEKNHVLNLYIDNATMQSDLPTLIGADIPITQIAAASVNGNLKFNISLKSGAFLRSANLNKESKNPELVISIASPQLPPEEIVKATSSIKSPAMQTIITDQYQNAVRLSESGNKQAAIEKLTKLLEFYPDYNDARVALAAIILETGNAILARKVIDDGLAVAPDYLPLIELKARLLTSEGKNKEALMVLQSEQPLITDAPQYHALIAALYNRENNFLLAAEIYKKLVMINPHEGSWWFGLGVSQDKLGHKQDAAYAYTKAATEGRLNAQAIAFLHTRLQLLQDVNHA